MLASLLAVVALANFAATPQSAAIGAQYVDPQKPPVVKRVNFAGRYAAVLTSGGRIEGELNNDPILVERFSFGWQALEVLNFRCSLESHNLGRDAGGALMRGMPPMEDDRPCRGILKDAGPRDEIESVRRLMRGPLVPYVVVSGNWAMGGWYGGGGGESLYRKRDGHWQLVISDGGAMGADDMKKYGVPKSARCAFGICNP